VKVGQAVKMGESLCTLESMKMENTIPAPRDAVVAEIHVSKGNTVSSEDVLFTLR
jgi:biotin carboxyl carrier protein